MTEDHHPSRAPSLQTIGMSKSFGALKALQEVIQGSATQFDNKGQQANEAALYFNPALSTTRRVVNELTRDQQALSDFLANGATVTRALSERGTDLTNLATNANLTAQAIGD